MACFGTTLTALAAPRRCVPIAAVVLALVGVQVAYGGWRAGLVPVAMSVGFTLLAPWSWRALLAGRGGPGALALYVAGALAVVGVAGLAVPCALGLGTTFLTDPGSLAVALVLYLVGGWGLGRDLELEQSLEHLRLQAIRAHLDPHFLSNTLNAIAEWCRQDAAVAETAAVQLGELLRAVLEALELRAWPLRRELELVGALLALHQIRDPEAFTAEVEVDPALAEAEVAPLVVVSLVENALKHGPRGGHRGVISVRVSARGGAVRCQVENPGPFSPRRGHVGRGVPTLRSRLAFAYGRDARLALGPVGTAPARTRAVLELGRLRR